MIAIFFFFVQGNQEWYFDSTTNESGHCYYCCVWCLPEKFAKKLNILFAFLQLRFQIFSVLVFCLHSGLQVFLVYLLYLCMKMICLWTSQCLLCCDPLEIFSFPAIWCWESFSAISETIYPQNAFLSSSEALTHKQQQGEHCNTSYEWALSFIVDWMCTL